MGHGAYIPFLGIRTIGTMTIPTFEQAFGEGSFAGSVPRLRSALVSQPAIAAWRRAGTAGTAVVLPLVLLGLWSAASRYELMSPQILPAPSIVWATARDLVASGQLQSELLVSMTRVAAGLLIGGTLGLAVGVATGLSRTAEAYLSPTVRAVLLVPSLGWLPFFMLLFGIGEALKIVMIAKACFLPMLVNNFDAVRNMPPRHREVARMLELGRLDTLRFVVLPAILPSFLNGLRLALSKGWQVMVLVEMIASAAGIGYLMTWGRKSFQLDVVLVTMVAIGIIGWLLDRMMLIVQGRTTGWSLQSIER
jgi:sulfonate transport system permease protein